MKAPPHTAHDLAADWSWMETARGFKVRGGSVEWDSADYPEHSRNGLVRISRVVTDDGRVIINVASVEPSLQSESTLRTIIHEFGHHFGDHLTHAFDDGMALVAARWVLRAAKRGKTS